MFEINDYVVYNSSGVFKIIDIIKEEDISNNETEYYVLQPAYNDTLTIKTPVNNPKLKMRKILTKEAVLSLIASIPERETTWINDDRTRYADFKNALKTDESDEWVRLIKTIYLKKQERSNLGKKIMKADNDIMEAAERNLYEEFAVALNISPDEVFSFISNQNS